MGQEKLILHQNKTIFWQQMSFYSCKDNCYQNCKVIVTKNLRWNYHLTMDEKWPNYRGIAARYWMSHQHHLAFYFWWALIIIYIEIITYHLLGSESLLNSYFPCVDLYQSWQSHWQKAIYLCLPPKRPPVPRILSNRL